MSAYISVNFTPIDKEKLHAYGAAVPATLTKYSGEYLAKGKALQLLGDSGYEMQVILKFPSKQLAEAWFNSPEYLTIGELRDAGMKSQFQLIEAVNN